jgi:alpha-D-xyloside xylohydrolase
VTAHAPGVFRLRFGPETKPDYGLLATPAPSGPKPELREVEPGCFKLFAGRYALKLKDKPLRFNLTGPGDEILETITDQHFRGWTRLPGFGRGERGWTAAVALGSGEPVYGLGEKFGRSTAAASSSPAASRTRSGSTPSCPTRTCRSAGALAFRRGRWRRRRLGVFVHTPATVVHGVGYAPWSQRSYALTVADEALDLFLFAGDTPAAILDAFTALTGRPAVPPLWSLGAGSAAPTTATPTRRSPSRASCASGASPPTC